MNKFIQSRIFKLLIAGMCFMAFAAIASAECYVHNAVDLSSLYNTEISDKKAVLNAHGIDIAAFKAETGKWQWKDAWAEGITGNTLCFNGKEYYMQNVYEGGSALFRTYQHGNNALFNIKVKQGFYHSASFLATGNNGERQLAVRFHYGDGSCSGFFQKTVKSSHQFDQDYPGIEIISKNLVTGSYGSRYIREYTFTDIDSEKLLTSIDILPADWVIGEDGSARKSEAVSPIPRDFDVFIMGIDLVTTPETEERGLELLNTQFAAIAGLLPGPDEVTVYDYACFEEAEYYFNQYKQLDEDLSGMEAAVYQTYKEKLQGFQSILSDSTQIVFYVSQTGNNEQEGSLQKPVADIETALEQIKKINAGYPAKKTFTIQLDGKSFQLKKTLALNNVNLQGDSALVIRGTGDTELTTAQKINQQYFKKDFSSEIKSRLPLTAKNHVLSINLSEAGIDQPKSIWNSWYSGISLYVGEDMQRNAAYPNHGFKRVENFENNTIYEDVFGEWKNTDAAYLEGYMGAVYNCLKYAGIRVASENKAIVMCDSIGTIKNTDRYRVVNLPELLDVPGEYYVDEENGELYYYPTEEFENSDCWINTFSGHMIALNSSQNITFENLKFCRIISDAIYLDNCTNITVSHCSFVNVGSGIMSENENNTKITVCDSYFANIGYNGVRLGGGDRAALTSSENVIINNIFENLSVYKKTYAPAVRVAGVGNAVINNTIRKAPHCAIMFAGAKNVIKHNKISDVCLDSADCGAIYSGRDMTWLGNEIAYNYFDNVRAIDPALVNAPTNIMQSAVYIDDRMGGIDIHHNYIRNSTRGIFIGGGSFIQIENNVVEGCDLPIRISPGGSMALADDALTQDAIQYFEENPVYYEEFDYLSYYKQENLDDVFSSTSHDCIVKNNKYKDYINEPGYSGNTAENNTEVSDIQAALIENGIGDIAYGTQVIEADRIKLIYPEDGEESIDIHNIEFYWNMHAGAREYVIEIFADEDLNNRLYSESTGYNYVAVTALPDDRDVYYWRVHAVLEEGEVFSPVYSFLNKYPVYLHKILFRDEFGRAVFDTQSAKKINISLDNNTDESIHIFAALYDGPRLTACIPCSNHMDVDIGDHDVKLSVCVYVWDGNGLLKPMAPKRETIYGSAA